MFDYSKIQNLPIAPHLNDIFDSLKNSKSGFLILTAETAAGKSTAVPIALMENFPGKILMLEPRRLAVSSITNRICELLNEKPGDSVGYRMQFENAVSDKTRVEIITEAILTRKLQNDSLLEGVSVVVIDEFHERSIHADLALALLKETLQLRDDLYVIVMSATMETDKLSRYLGGCKVINVPGRQFKIDYEYSKISVVQAVKREIGKAKTILVFLPGIYEIRKIEHEILISDINKSEIEILLLHSSLNIEEQRKVLSENIQGVTRIVLSSSIAETSVTVPGVSVVIDSGLSRVNRMNVKSGMNSLSTEVESEFSAKQRAGRAGRLGNGKCICLWNKSEPRVQNFLPEILRTDLSALVLECYLWGIDDFNKLDWLDSPNKALWNSCEEVLEMLGCIKNGKITEKGKIVANLPVHPRLGCVALSGNYLTCFKYSNYEKSSEKNKAMFLSSLKSKVESSGVYSKCSELEGVLSGFADRIAHLNKDKNYQFASGRIAKLSEEEQRKISVLPEWIVAPEVMAGEREGKIFSYLSGDEIKFFVEQKSKTKIIAEISNNKLIKNEIKYFGKIELSRKSLKTVPEDFGAALCNQVKSKGIYSLPISKETESFLRRAEFYYNQRNKNFSLEDIAYDSEKWLLPFLSGKTNIDFKTVYDSLYYFLDGAEIDKNVPEFLVLSNGKKRRLLYEKQNEIRPVLEIIIQQIFGCFETPKVMGVPVLLKLLSPARRPLQITDDLENFWKKTWPQICKEMKGRYPKHNWDYRLVQNDEK